MSLPPVYRMLVGALYKGSTKVEIRLFNNCLQDDFSDGEYLFSLCTCGCATKWYMKNGDCSRKTYTYVHNYEAIENVSNKITFHTLCHSSTWLELAHTVIHNYEYSNSQSMNRYNSM